MSLFKYTCRCCMIRKVKNSKSYIKEVEMVSIFAIAEEFKEETKTWLDILQLTTPQLKISLDDKLPKMICVKCMKKIKDIFKFQQNCFLSENAFYKILTRAEEQANNDRNEECLIHPHIHSSDCEKNVSSAAAVINKDELPAVTIEHLKNLKDEEFIYDSSLESLDGFMLSEEDDIEKELNRNLEDLLKSCDDFGLGMILSNDFDRKTNVAAKRPTKSISKDLIESLLESIENEAAQKRYPCNKCKRKLKSECSLAKHKEMHGRKEQETCMHVCETCDKAFYHNDKLKEHINSHNDDKPFLCSECGKGFLTSSTLKQHSLRHKEERQYPCPHCPKKLPTKPDLDSHLRVHNKKPKPHICNECGRGFSRPFLLKQHFKYHTNERNFQCDFCEKMFFTNEKLQRHRRIHTGEKPYKCKFCEKAYVQSNELTKHLRKHLGDNVYQCELCPQRFPNVKSVRDHFTTHKNDNLETRARYLAELNAMELKGIFCL